VQKQVNKIVGTTNTILIVSRN